MTFEEVDAILGTPLLKLAYRLETWWTNVQPKIQSHRPAWLNHGWTVGEFDLEDKRVKFVRAGIWFIRRQFDTRVTVTPNVRKRTREHDKPIYTKWIN